MTRFAVPAWVVAEFPAARLARGRRGVVRVAVRAGVGVIGFRVRVCRVAARRRVVAFCVVSSTSACCGCSAASAASTTAGTDWLLDIIGRRKKPQTFREKFRKSDFETFSEARCHWGIIFGWIQERRHVDRCRSLEKCLVYPTTRMENDRQQLKISHFRPIGNSKKVRFWVSKIFIVEVFRKNRKFQLKLSTKSELSTNEQINFVSCQNVEDVVKHKRKQKI